MTPVDPVRPIAVFASFSGAGGVERMLVNLLRGCVALGAPVELALARADSPHLAQLPPDIARYPLGAAHSLTVIPALARYLRRRRPRVLLAAKDRAGRAALLARRLAGTDTPIVLRLGTHLSTALGERSVLARALRQAPIRWLYPALDGIVAVSDGVAEDIARIARVPRARIRTIRNPTLVPELATLAAAPCPHPWLASAQPPTLVAIGRLQHQKDFPTLLRAFARLYRARPCRLLILGEGGERARLETLIAALGLDDAVALLGFRANPYAYLARAALFVLSSRWEGSPNALVEALALGTPAVATDCPSGPAEILAKGRFGPLVPVGDEAALAAAMARVLDDPPAPATLRAAVRDYDYRLSAANYLEFLSR